MTYKNNFFLFFLSILISLFLTLICFTLNAQTEASWEHYKTAGVFDIYTRSNTTSGIKEVRIQTQMTTSLQGIMAALSDAEAYQDWVFKCSTSKKLKTISEREYYYYTQTNMPFPVDDRDLIVHSKQWQDEAGVIHSKSVAQPHFEPKKEGIVRVEHFESKWEVQANGDGTVAIDYQVKTNPGGNIPIWMINLGVASGPLKTMEKLAEIVQLPKYQQANYLSYIVDNRPSK